MAKKKIFYAVRKGHHPGIYKSWEECQDQVHGFSGAEYQGFENYQKALMFMAGQKGCIGYEDGGRTEEEGLLVEFKAGKFSITFSGNSWSVSGSVGDSWFTARWDQTSDVANCWHQQKGDIILTIEQVKQIIKKYA